MSDKTKQAATAAADKGTEGGVVAKCGSCTADQPATHKCCSECGQPMAPAAQVDFQAALDGLGAFHKANTELPKKVEVAPGDHQAAGGVLAKARTVEGADPNDVALVELLIGGQNINSDQIGALLGETRAVRIGLGELAGFMAKAFTAGFKAHEQAYTTAIAALTARVDEWEGQPGRSRSAQIGSVIKAAVRKPEGDEQDDSPRGEVLVKAAIDLGTALKLGTTDVTLTQQYANAGHSLQTIATVDPVLHRRLTAAGLGAATTH